MGFLQRRHELFPLAVRLSTPSQHKCHILHEALSQALWGPPHPVYVKSLGQWQNTSKGIHLVWLGSSLDRSLCPCPLPSAGSSLLPAPNPLSHLPTLTCRPDSLYSRRRVAVPTHGSLGRGFVHTGPSALSPFPISQGASPLPTQHQLGGHAPHK